MMMFEKSVCALPKFPKLPNLPNVRASSAPPPRLLRAFSAPTNYFSGESGSCAITA